MRHPAHPAVCSAALLGSVFAVTAVHAAEFARVVSATPVSAAVPVARQTCSDSRQLVQLPPSGAGAVLGAIAGGVIGHSVGGGFGRAAATGIGAMAGSVIGNQVEADTNPVLEVPVRRCRTASGYENRVVGYDVMYEYAGQRYSTRMARDPGPQMAVSMQPALADGASAPAPVFDDRVPPTAPPPPTVYYDEPAERPIYSAPSASFYDAPYYAPNYAPYYYLPSPSVYIAPVIGFGFGYYGGHFGGSYGGPRGGRHWH